MISCAVVFTKFLLYLINVFQNGGEFGAGSSNGLLRGSKTSVYEAGTRVPAAMYAKEAKKKGRRENGMFHIVDWHKTILGRIDAERVSKTGIHLIFSEKNI